jgi:hypothetical protein
MGIEPHRFDRLFIAFVKAKTGGTVAASRKAGEIAQLLRNPSSVLRIEAAQQENAGSADVPRRV